MTPSQRVVLNTAVAYARSMVALILMLFTSRWVLNALGQTDFGLYSVVGSIIVFITVLNAVMSGSVARHYAYAIGGGNPDEINLWFNAALGIHLVLASVLVLIGWPIGEYVIAHILTIPMERISACLWVFRISLLSAFFSMVSMPFVAMFTARQRLIEQSCWLMGYSLLVFFLAMHLDRVSGDRLIFYAIGMVIIIICIQVGQIIHAMTVFKDCRIKLLYLYNRGRCKEVCSFAGWNLFGALGGTIRDQGSAVLLNLHFGPKVNAAYGIAMQVSAATTMLTNAMLNALSPEMTSSEGRGDRARMLSLAQRASKFGTIFIMLFALPLIAEMDYVLKLWLREPPAFAAIFCQLILITILIDRLSGGVSLAVSAHGRIAAYQATMGTCVFLTLPLAWVFLKLGAPPAIVGVAFIIIMSITTLYRAFCMQWLLAVSVWRWVKDIFLPCSLVALVATLGATTSRLLLDPSFTRLVITSASGMLATILTAWFLALDCRERKFFRHNTLRLLTKSPPNPPWRRRWKL